MRTPPDALQARTSVAAAQVGRLTTYARHPSRQTTTTVGVQPQPDGTVVVQLGREAVGSQQLLARPVATLELAPVGHDPVLLHGAVSRLPGVGPHGRLCFRLEVAAVRLGSPSVLIDEQEYATATPDPLAADAPAVLGHLNDAHADGLVACLRAFGHKVEFAYATTLDSGGLTVAIVSTGSVDLVRLSFPHPVSALSQLPTSLSLVLAPRCRCSAPRTRPGPLDERRSACQRGSGGPPSGPPDG